MGGSDFRIAVPAYFKCPISLDIMKSPVSLSTGVTYDRSSIEKWLADGHNTCPATMQPLESRELVPNHTLRRLIEAWSTSTQFSDKGFSPYVDSERVKLYLDDITDGHFQHEALRDHLTRLVDNSEDHLSKASAVQTLASILSARESDIWNGGPDVIEKCEETIKVLSVLPLDKNARRIVAGRKQLMSLAWFLVNGTAAAKVSASILLGELASSNDIKHLIGETGRILEGLLNMLKEGNPIVVNPSLICLLKLCTLRRNQLSAVENGAVGLLLNVIYLGEKDITERVLGLLDLLILCAEGRAAMKSCSAKSIPLIIKTLLRFSDLASQHAIDILWSICYSFPDSEAPQIIVDSNGLPKILLLLQSDCNSVTRKKAEYLLKRCCDFSAKDVNCCSLRDSQYTYIKPF